MTLTFDYQDVIISSSSSSSSKWKFVPNLKTFSPGSPDIVFTRIEQTEDGWMKERITENIMSLATAVART